ncbi:hypothetical protein M2152_001502 [Microbacteriaceae bacterium SG_E_30_P1]|uniref:Polyketide cyclase / dehydrase and lipid transport n=1 Tax=Antiquaquibacter oligotrophicus TaxID=2880260 RepID=A0ABT6KMT5_9MICO|nr:SRPBCC family protein [Antiquaquibacter oligotrophicus]MDH6181320.1 hypothetical protein [Antiquaquibacter oligotrophicus]UDF12987.1 SRPBCC family protein [Antiquaquibacter oligotrophicus]
MTTPSAPVSATALVSVLSHPVVAWEFVTGLDPASFYPSYGPLPAVVGVRDQSGDWTTAGQERTLLLSDGGHVVEHVTDAESPTFFAYQLSDFQRLFGVLVSGARAEWRFEKTAHGTRILWTYSFFAKPGRRLIVRAIVKAFWSPYMERVLPGIAAATPSASRRS